MTITIQFSKSLSSHQSPLIVPFYTHDTGAQCAAADFLSDKALSVIAGVVSLQDENGFSGKDGQSLELYFSADVPEGARRVILFGLGEKRDMSAIAAENLGGKLCAILNGLSSQSVVVAGEGVEHPAHFVLGAALRSYRFERYKTMDQEKAQATQLKSLEFCAYDAEITQEEYQDLVPVLSGVELARDLVNEAPNALYPESYAALIVEELKPLGVDIEVLDEKKMRKMGMGAIMAVGQGSERQPRMVVMRWKGKGVAKDAKPIALVGKGVTFDTGGISIKPSAGMDEMKMDMGGSAAVVGTMKTLALREAPAYVVGIVGLAENMPSANAYRPGDIVTSYAGKTIEVLNTDAEGRLVLADALAYVQEKYDPDTIIDLATLTGAMMVALGNEYCGTFANDDALWDDMSSAAKNADEKIWRMPLDDAWSKEMLSAVADLRNIGQSRFAGACTAAAFLQHFVDKGRKWAHMDIAGTAWVKKDKPTVPKFGTGFGVRTLNQLVKQAYDIAKD